MKKTIAILIMLALASTSFAQWVTIASDPPNDASMSGLEGVLIEYQYDEPNDNVLFRVTYTNLSVYSSSPSADFSFALPNGLASGNPAGTHWTSTTPVHKTSYVYPDNGGSAPTNYSFTSWANQIEETATITLLCFSGCVSLNVDVANNQITYTFNRTDIITDSEMSGSSATIGLVMNVGYNLGWTDALTHSQNGASLATFTITKGLTSIHSVEKDKVVGLYPNPAIEQLNLRTEIDFTRMEIHDIFGKVVRKYNSKLTRVDVSSLQRGMYFITLYNDVQKIENNLRFVKQ